MKNSQKGFAISIIIFFVVLLTIGVGMYAYTVNKVAAPSNISTTTVPNWRVYTNEQLLGLVEDQIGLEEIGTYYFLGLEGNYLVLDFGTAPDPRGLSIFDLNTRKLVYSDRYSKPIIIKDNSIKYWSPISEEITTEKCPESADWKSSGLGAGIESYVEVNLLNFSKKELGEFRCMPRQ